MRDRSSSPGTGKGPAYQARLKGLVRERDVVEEETNEASEAPIDLAEMADGRRVVHISATLSEDVQLPSVRAYMVLRPGSGVRSPSAPARKP